MLNNNYEFPYLINLFLGGGPPTQPLDQMDKLIEDILGKENPTIMGMEGIDDIILQQNAAQYVSICLIYTIYCLKHVVLISITNRRMSLKT